LRLIVILLLTAGLVGCTGSAQGPSDIAAAEIQRIAPANAAAYKSVDLKAWRNPYLIVKSDGIGLLDVSNSEEHLIKIEELPGRLAQMPTSAWPYGRVVALADDRAPASDKARIRDNKANIAATLHGLNIDIEWVPSS
jgi:hypothetical protein